MEPACQGVFFQCLVEVVVHRALRLDFAVVRENVEDWGTFNLRLVS